MRQITIDGNLGKDAEVKESKNGAKFLVFSIANRFFDGKEERTEWIDVRVFNPMFIEKRASFLKKGRYVIVSGTYSNSVSSYNNQLYINQSVLADYIDFPSVGGGKKNTDTPAEAQPSTYTDHSPAPVVAESAPTYVPEQPVMVNATASLVDAADASDDLPF